MIVIKNQDTRKMMVKKNLQVVVVVKLKNAKKNVIPEMIVLMENVWNHLKIVIVKEKVVT
tara:strand:+ start:826 stop:1005 length:180 start_codon:yes stop_codon:yes gene_type:complete